jgi:hypothetical protein
MTVPKNNRNMQQKAKSPKPTGTIYFSPLSLPGGRTLYVGTNGTQMLYLAPVSAVERAVVKAATGAALKMTIYKLGK